MSELEAILLGALQGVTEFLPISSSGHLKLGAALLGIEEPAILFDIILHVGSLMAVFVIYRQSLWEILRDLWKSAGMLSSGEGWRAAIGLEGTRLSLLIAAATLPTGVIGLLLDKLLEGPYVTTAVVGGALVVNGGVLLASRKAGDKNTDKTPTDKNPWSLWGLGLGSALIVGVSQGIAVMPGLSRAGLTITTCLLMGVEREKAARFSFLLSIPAILGALVLKFDAELFTSGDVSRLLPYGLGALAAFIVGALSLVILIQMLRKARFHHFAWYCFAVGASAILWTLFQP